MVSALVAFVLSCMYLAGPGPFILYVRKTATATDLCVALLHRDLRRTRACPLIAESVKSIVRVLCCNASYLAATSLLPLTLPGETIEDLSSNQ